MSYADQLDRIAEDLTREGNHQLAREARDIAQHVRMQLPAHTVREQYMDSLAARHPVLDQAADLAGTGVKFNAESSEANLDALEAQVAGRNHEAADLDQPALLRAQRLKKPSAQHKSDLYVCRIFRRSGGDCQIYEDVKHLWWTADSSVLVIVQYTNPECTQWRNISWLREVIDWYTLTHQEFE